ncbi:MAG: sulfatase [Planctomycetes bacterium]|nr:sulfatase [Planctomycetota bacterium]
MSTDLVDLRYRLSRRGFLQAGVASACAAGTLGTLPRALSAAETPAAGDRPNVVLIIGDDQGWTDFGFMGHPAIQTPHLDRLAATGVLFPQAYVAAPLCRPSLATLLTGLYPHQHKICSNDPPGTAAERASRDYQYMKDLPTVPRLLAPLGYRSLQTGKYWEHHYSTGGFTEGMTVKGRHGEAGLVIGRQGMEPITRFVDDCAAKRDPFFIWYAPFLPHEPHNPPQRLLDKYTAEGRPERVAKYYAMCDWFDETCGELVATLEKKGVRDNTLIVYITDNGWTEGYLAEKTYGQMLPGKRAWPQRKGKQHVYDGGVRTPVILNWPGRIKPGKSMDLIEEIDLVPTILAACGVRPTADMQGINLLDAPKRAARKAVFGEGFIHTANDMERPAANLRARWVREGAWKLILPAKTDPEFYGDPELYNLDDDPFEKCNLAAENAEKVAHLRGLLDAWWTPE